ncbi:hypothetical protein CPB86DRAFT_344398 [Serendipita vermifera]|nr:hypothetical protein CPB86DRAFT_344398 [Serendipita vermifera]
MTSHVRPYSLDLHLSNNPQRSAPLSPRKHLTARNLKEYLYAYTLPHLPISDAGDVPDMPEPGKKAHRNHLNVQFDERRALKSIFRIKVSYLTVRIQEYMDTLVAYGKHSPSLSLDRPQDPRLPTTVSTLAHVSQHVHHHVLLNSERLMHVLNPDGVATSYRWSTLNDPYHSAHDNGYVNMYQWKNTTKVEEPRMIAFVQAPWVLADRDITNFTQTKSMPQMPRQFTGKERLWAKVYDVCTRQNCRWFLVTTYDKWCIGVFSKAYQAAFVSLEVPTQKPWLFPSACPPTTPMQAIFFWLASCMGVKGTYVPDLVMESVHQPQPITSPTRRSVEAKRGRDPIVFQASDSEEEEDDDFGDNMTTYSRAQHGIESELSFQSTNISPTLPAQFLRNVRLPKQHRHLQQQQQYSGGVYAQNGQVRAPLGGDELNKETVLPRRGDWGTPEQIEQLQNARVEQHRDRKRIETIEWLEEEDLNAWQVEDTSVPLRRDATPVYRRWLEYEMQPDPPSPVESVEGSIMMDARELNANAGVGKAVFALAPKHPRRQYDV